MMDPALIACQLTTKNDDNNKILLLQDKLIITYQSKSQVIPRNAIRSINLNKKKLIVPLVIGGIGTSLAIVALSLGWYHRLFNLLTVLFFSGILYYGLNGKDALEIFEKNGSHIFLLNKVTPKLIQFVKFFTASQVYSAYKGKQHIYHLVDPEIWNEHLDSDYYVNSSLDHEGFIHASSGDQLAETYSRYYANKETMVVLMIDPAVLEAELRYEKNTERDQSFPHIFGPINKNAIVGLKYFSSNIVFGAIEDQKE